MRPSAVDEQPGCLKAPCLVIDVDRKKAADFGLSAQDVILVGRLGVNQETDVKDDGEPLPFPFARFGLTPVPGEHLIG